MARSHFLFLFILSKTRIFLRATLILSSAHALKFGRVQNGVVSRVYMKKELRLKRSRKRSKTYAEYKLMQLKE